MAVVIRERPTRCEIENPNAIPSGPHKTHATQIEAVRAQVMARRSRSSKLSENYKFDIEQTFGVTGRSGKIKNIKNKAIIYVFIRLSNNNI